MLPECRTRPKSWVRLNTLWDSDAGAKLVNTGFGNSLIVFFFLNSRKVFTSTAISTVVSNIIYNIIYSVAVLLAKTMELKFIQLHIYL